MSKEHEIIVSEGLGDVYRGFSNMTTAMECLAESRILNLGGPGVAASILDMFSDLSRPLLDKLDGLMLLIGRSEPSDSQGA